VISATQASLEASKSRMQENKIRITAPGMYSKTNCKKKCPTRRRNNDFNYCIVKNVWKMTSWTWTFYYLLCWTCDVCLNIQSDSTGSEHKLKWTAFHLHLCLLAISFYWQGPLDRKHQH